MLAQLRQRVAAALASERAAVLTTSGPAGVQVQFAPYVADGLRLLLYVPCGTDLLVNLEPWGDVVVTTASWQLWGRGRRLEGPQLPAPPALPDAAWYAVVEVVPSRVSLAHRTGWGAAETIDLDGPP